MQEDKPRLVARCEDLGVTPRVWLRLPGYVIRNYSPDLEESVVLIMKQTFLRDEPIFSGCGVADDPVSLNEYELWVRSVLTQNISLIALPEDSPGADLKAITEKVVQLSGINILTLSHKDDPRRASPNAKFKGVAIRKAFNTIGSVLKLMTEDPFEKYGIFSTMNAAGLAVNCDHRGRGLSKALLEARFVMCRDLGVKLTKTLFTSTPAQRAAFSCGFQEMASVRYGDLKEENGNLKFPLISPDETLSVTIKLIS